MVWNILLAILPLAVLANVEMDPGNHWSGSFQAQPCFIISAELTSWRLHLVFDQPVTSLEVWRADIESVSDDKTEYILTNKQWNGVEHVGDELCIDFIGHGDEQINPHITAFIEELPDGGTNQAVTQAPTTTRSLAPGETYPPTTPTTPLPLPSGEGITSTMTIKNDYGSRFEGWIDFDIDQEFLSWVMKIHFSKPVSAIHQPTHANVYSHNADGTEWVLVGNDDFLHMKPGDHMQIRFNADLASGETTPVEASALLINMGHDNWTVACPPNSAQSKYNYDCVLMESIMFYEAQRSGKLPDNNRIPWRGDSALDDHGLNGEDLSGGWYDAGDYVKFNFPMAWATVVLEWGLLEFKDAYEASGQLDWMYECVKWPLDYLLKCHVADDVLYAQVGDGGKDHGSWGRPEDMTMQRPAFKIDASNPGSDLAMETAAAFAAGSMVFKERNATYAATLLEHAKTLWDFAIQHQGKYSSSVSAAAGYYSSFNITDEMCWGSLWLYKATGEQKYLDEAKKWFDPSPDWGMSWDDVIIGNQILMYNLTGEELYKQAVEGTFTDWFPGGSIQYSPKGLAYRLQWGSLRYASNMAMSALMAAQSGIHPDEYRHWAMCQIHYALGDAGHSFVVGFGENPPQQPHHRSSSCPNPPGICNMNVLHIDVPNVHTLYGALVGGPDGSDGYKDSRNNYVNNEVANDYNAGFQTAVAGLRHLLLTNEHPEQTGDATCPYT
ncbi:hypothetical protein BaRGS_00035986 [Batillaria attramentaria]|uniref:Endoglucanase n=1 Tax=Batillaria attramentaria TaxID=370345 RepID=A0ABD0JCP4_9CAEN